VPQTSASQNLSQSAMFGTAVHLQRNHNFSLTPAFADPVPIGFTSAPIKVLTGHTRCVSLARHHYQKVALRHDVQSYVGHHCHRPDLAVAKGQRICAGVNILSSHFIAELLIILSELYGHLPCFITGV
jgi:hypothetical protein